MRAITLKRRAAADDGATAAEYAILLALIVAAVITAIQAVGDTSSGVWGNDVEKIQAAIQRP
jgi:Flp pilus assembly pilin Flp